VTTKGYFDRFAKHLSDKLSEAGRPRATMRRSLAFAPGSWPAAFPYIEPFVAGAKPWTRKVAYLVAGLYTTAQAGSGQGNVGNAAARLSARTDSTSVETRFIVLLDADEEQLPHRLRQMVTLMASHDIAPDWATLCRDLVDWRREDRRVQQSWAQEYYLREARSISVPDTKTSPVDTNTSSNEDSANSAETKEA